MNRQEFLDQLKKALWSMPEADKQRSADYYAEMIDDRMEDGLSEEEAVAAIGELEEIVKQILTESPRPPQVVQTDAPKRNRVPIWLVVLLVLGFPVWGAIVISVAAVILSVWLSLWSVVIGLYATTFALGISALGCILGSFFLIGRGTAIVAWGAALVCAGLAILLFLLSNLAAKGMVRLTKLSWNAIFRRKERSV